MGNGRPSAATNAAVGRLRRRTGDNRQDLARARRNMRRGAAGRAFGTVQVPGGTGRLRARSRRR